MKSLEGVEILIKSQDIKFPKKSCPQSKKTLNGDILTMFQITLNVNGEGEILAEHNPKQPIFCSESLLEKGSIINGRKLSGFSEEPVKSYKVGGEARTGSHPRQHTKMEGISYLTVCEDHSGNVIDKMPHDMFLPDNCILSIK